MNKYLTALAASLAILAPQAPGIAASSDKVLYTFETGTDGFWTFANGATLKLDADKTTGAGGSSGSLKASYQWQPGGGSYMGIGIQPKWSMAGDSWVNYAKGHAVVSFKSDVPGSTRIELRASDKKTYSFAVDAIPATWKDYTIPFSKFTSDGKSIDLSAVDIDQIVIIPSKVNDDAHTLWMDNVTISKEPVTP